MTTPSAAGTLAHTNHYACERMRRYEGDPAYALRSAVRLGRALELLDGPRGAGPEPGTITSERMLAFLADHATSPSICRHDDGSETSVTVFWCLADVTAGEIRYGLGPRCRGNETRYRFERDRSSGIGLDPGRREVGIDALQPADPGTVAARKSSTIAVWRTRSSMSNELWPVS